MSLTKPAAALCVGLSFIAVETGSGAQAAPVTKETCIASNEGAQVARQKGELRFARDQLLVCISESCPGPVRDDCKDRLAEVERAVPSIVFTAKDPAGNALTAVTVLLDDKPFAEKLDGTALIVDPGEHVFKLSASGYQPVVRKVQLREGEKAHSEEIVFPLGSAASAPPPPVVVAPPRAVGPPEEPPAAPSSNGDTQRTIAFILGGAGIVGVGIGAVFGFVAKSTYDDATKSCPSGPTSCDDKGVEGGEGAHGQAAVSTAAFILGGVLLAAGVTTFLTAPRRSGVSVQPTASAGGAGIRIGGAW